MHICINLVMSISSDTADDEITPTAGRRSLMIEGSGHKIITSKESSAMALLASLAVEAAANCAYILGKSFQPILKDVLYPLIELLVDNRAGNLYHNIAKKKIISSKF